MNMNRIVGFGLAAAALVAVVLIGSQLLGSPTPGVGSGTTPSPEPSPTTAPSEAEPSVEPSTGAGSPVVWLDGSDGGVPITMTVPAPGWDPDLNFFAIERNGNSAPPDGAAILAFTNRSAWSVPGDPCHFESTLPDTPSATVDELVAALSAQALRDASAPVDITVDGHAGKSITLHVPDPVPADCDNDQFCTMVDPTVTSGPPEDACARIAQSPGQIDELWIVVVDGMAVIIDAAYYEGTPDEHVEEMRAIVDSITFELP